MTVKIKYVVEPVARYLVKRIEISHNRQRVIRTMSEHTNEKTAKDVAKLFTISEPGRVPR